MVKKWPKYGQKMPKPLFKASNGFFQLFVLILLMKYIEGHHKVSFETIYTLVWSFWGSPVAKHWSKKCQKMVENYQKFNLCLLEVRFICLVYSFWSKLLRNITNFHFIPLTLICDDFESLQNLKMHWFEILLETFPQNWEPIFAFRFANFKENQQYTQHWVLLLL